MKRTLIARAVGEGGAPSAQLKVVIDDPEKDPDIERFESAICDTFRTSFGEEPEAAGVVILPFAQEEDDPADDRPTREED